MSEGQLYLEYPGGHAVPLDEVAGVLLDLHKFTHDHRRYTFAASVWRRVLCDLDIRPNTMHQLCVGKLPLTLLEIAKDPDIYVWPLGPASPHYHPELELYTMNIYKMLMLAYIHMINSEDFDKCYRGLALKLLQMTPAIWPVLWNNRAVLAPSSGEVRFNEEGLDEGFPGAVLDLIHRVMQCTEILFGKTPQAIPRLSLGMVEILICCWQSLPELLCRATCIRLLSVLIIDSQSPAEEYRKVLDKVIPDAEAADHVAKLLFKDIYDKTLLDHRLSCHFKFLDVLMRGATHFVQPGTPRDGSGPGILRCIAAACQRQLCSRSVLNPTWELPNICEGLNMTRIMLKDHGPILGTDGDFYDLESVGTLCRVSSNVLASAVQQNAGLLCENVIVLFDLYASALYAIDVNSRGGKLKIFRDILRYCWFKAMAGLEPLKLRPHMDSYYVVEQLRIIGHNLGMIYTRYSRPPVDPENVDTGDRLCHQSECLCHEIVPYHSLRVCKGCWKVFYCSELCQKRDWERGGHRFKCIGRRERHSEVGQGKGK